MHHVTWVSAEAEVLAPPRMVSKGNGVLPDYVRCDSKIIHEGKQALVEHVPEYVIDHALKGCRGIA